MGRVVPFNDLGRQGPELIAALCRASARVIESGWYLLGPETEAFESEFADHTGVSGCVSVANGTDALEIALRSVGCTRGDEVVVPANAGMYATTACVAIGATPVFPDIDPGTLLVTPERVAAMVTAKTRAVVITHLYGNVVDVAAVRAALPDEVALVEDCAQAHGALLRGRPVGSLGDVGAFSFYPTKNLGALGDAGAVTSSDPQVLARARALRQYGWEDRYRATTPGGRNSRMDEMQAAMLRVLLPRLSERNEQRAAIRARYVDALGDRLQFVEAAEGCEPVVHLCVVRVPEREALMASLQDLGVSTAIHFPVPDHLQVALQEHPFRHDGLQESSSACAEVLSLPCFPELTEDEVDHVVSALVKCT